MSQLDAIFQTESNRQLMCKMFDWIDTTKCRSLEQYSSYASYLPRLSECERYVILVWLFVGEVENGGIHQFLTNSTGESAEEARKVMHKIGATKAAKALDEVSSVFFENMPIPSDPALIDDILSEWDDKHGKGSANSFLDKYDAELYDGPNGNCESVVNAIALYIRSHKEMFT
jgi:hypothetical protein